MKKLTTAGFIIKAVNKHGDKYGYDKVNYINGSTKVPIYCKKHQEYFNQTPNNHTNGSGCDKCGQEATNNKQSLPKKDFLTKSIKVHGDLYNYDNIIYTNSSNKISIWCNRCNDYFVQKPTKHMAGQGCPNPKCSLTKTTEQFIKEAIDVHGDLYGYNLVDYKHTNTPVIIECFKHGPFEQEPHGHLKGYGCYKCGRDSLGDKTRMSEEEYLSKAKVTHGDLYDYSEIIYVALNKPITPICKVHGKFTQRADGHLKYGCVKCGWDAVRVSYPDFVKRAKDIHGNKYKYSSDGYNGTKDKVKIKCNEHGIFYQVGQDHLRGWGCSSCTSSRGERKLYTLLTKHKYNFITEYSLPKSIFRYDYYLPELNILIEYDGIQHFKPIEFFGGLDAHEHTKENDKLKNELASLHNIPLIRIPYTKFNTLEDYLHVKLRQHIKYNRDGKYFKNFLEFSREYNLPGDATPSRYKEYLF